ncbi:MAG: hypothetical protein AAGE93_27765 [Bacteroidota bacterium]
MIKIILITPFIFATFLAAAQDLVKLERDSILLLHFGKAGGLHQWKQLKSYYIKRSSLTTSPLNPSHERSLDSYSTGYTNIYFQDPDQYRDELYKDGRGAIHTFITNRDESKLFRHNIERETILPSIYHESILYSHHIHSIGVTPILLSAYEKDSLEYEGIVDAYGKICYMFFSTVKNPVGNNSRLVVYIDVITNLVHATTTTSPKVRHKLYTDYRDVDGFMVPHTNTSYDNGTLLEEYKILEARINQPIDNLLFEVW